MDSLPIELCERGLVPDALARAGMRRLIGARLAAANAHDDGARRERELGGVRERARHGPIAEHTRQANDQHYEVPAAFFEQVLGPRLKYSGCLFEPGADLAAAEEAMLALYAERAGLADGQRILDLGCGWGSFALWAAQRYPGASLVAVSNSAGQKAFIDARAQKLGLVNLEVRTCDINDFEPGGQFDRVVSVELFEHLRNYSELFRRIRGWLAPDGRLFAHIFCHRLLAYPFVDAGAGDWMARHFFTGGIMPSQSLLLDFADDLAIQERWWVGGQHYQATANAWLAKLDANRAALRELFAGAYGEAQADRRLQRWRMFFMAVAELFGFNGGSEWGVGHYLFAPRQAWPLAGAGGSASS